MPRMVAVGDLDLDEKLGAALDPLGAVEIPPACDPVQRWLALDRLIAEERAAEGMEPLPGRARLGLARDMARTIDRLLVEEKRPEDLLGDAVLDSVEAVAEHWKRAIRLFARVNIRWQAELETLGQVDAATRRNLLFDRAARRLEGRSAALSVRLQRASPAPHLRWRVCSGSSPNCPMARWCCPIFDREMGDDAWDELGRAGASDGPGGAAFGAGDALTHPQYHLKLLLGRMGVNRAEVQPWHRRGIAAAAPARSRAISSLFLPPLASRAWVDLPADKRRLCRGAVADQRDDRGGSAGHCPCWCARRWTCRKKRIAVITADRGLARRVVQHLERWNIAAR